MGTESELKNHRFLLTALFAGHLTNDWVAGTLWLLAPAIAISMGLGPVEVGLILTINGIGAGLAHEFAERGARVLVAARSEAKLREVIPL